MVNMVPKYYMMDPDTEKLLSNGTLLRNGMKVLTESPDFRVNIDKDLQPWEMARALKRNRWAMISDIVWERKHGGDMVIFIATYEDGSQTKEEWSIDCAWLIKKSSIPDQDETRLEKVAKLVAAAMIDGTRTLYSEDLNDDEKASQLTETIEKSARQILDIL